MPKILMLSDAKKKAKQDIVRAEKGKHINKKPGALTKQELLDMLLALLDELGWLDSQGKIA